jgi:hypothetical protein
MADLDWNHGGAAQVVAALGDAATKIGGPATALGAGVPGDVGPDVEGMLDDLGHIWQRDLGRRSAAVGTVRDALAALDRTVAATDTAVTI